MEEDKIIIVFTAAVLSLFVYLYSKRLFRQRIKLMEKEKKIAVTASVLAGETVERNRLARNLDALGGMLSVVKINLDSADSIRNTRELLDNSIGELRRLTHDLEPVALNGLGLKAALEDFCNLFSNVHFRCYGNDLPADENMELLVYRCVYELVNNAVKHSEAKNIDVHLLQNADSISLTVIDNGCGFDPAKVTWGTGLHNLKNHLAVFNGNLDLNSIPGKGTEASVEVKL